MTVRNVAVLSAQLLLRGTLRLLSGVVPRSRTVVVSGFPETEGNAVETARALLRRYDGRVVWLTEDAVPHADVVALAAQGMLLVPKVSLRGVWAYLRAEAVLFTHGLYGSPRPSRRKPLVNLWHGDGPKATRPGKGAGSLIPGTFLVASTEVFGGCKAEAFEVPAERLLVTGNPRTDRMWCPADAEALRALGVTGDFVVWMPTFRRTRAVGAVRPWAEGGGEVGDAHLGPLLAGLRERGLQLVVKPHPMDADRRGWPGAVTVTEADLARAGTSLYAFLGASSGLVTDYSSVWVDYLLLDRPVAFLVADHASYTRALEPADVLEWLPGERVDRAGFAGFFADLDAGGALGAVRRKEVAARIGLNPTRSSADDLVTALAERGVLRLRRPEHVAAGP